jgi:hypothetical protein
LLLRVIIAPLLVGILVNIAHAEVHKCRGAGGKMTISDLPCEQGLPPSSSSSTKTQANTNTLITKEKTLAEGYKNDTSSRVEALEDRIMAAHTSECRALRQHLYKQGGFKEGILTKQSKDDGKESVWSLYEATCAARANDITALYLAQKENAMLEAVRKRNCEAKALNLQKRQENKSSLTEKQAEELAVLATEVARGCR